MTRLQTLHMRPKQNSLPCRLAAAGAAGLTADKRTAAGRLRRRLGFTIVEMLVVLAIIGLIVGLIGPRVLGILADSKVKTARIQMENLASSLDVFFLDTGRYPTSGEGLTALMQRPNDAPAWSGPYLKGSVVPNDPWGHAYTYKSPGQNAPFELSSQGPDGRENGRVQRIGEPAR